MDCLSQPGRAALPHYAALAEGAWRRRHLPGTDRPLLVQYPVNGPPERVIEVVRRHQVGDGWVAFDEPGLWPYIATGEPVLLTYRHEELIRHQLEGDAAMAAFLDRLEQRPEAGFVTFQVGEWENWLHFDPVTVFGLTVEQIRSLGRAEVHARAMATFRRWRAAVRGRLHSVNGYGLISHLGAEAGEDLVGIESGENVPATQVQRAFARGAARQFGLPWGEQISQWYRATVPTGHATEMVDLTPGGVHPTWVGPHTGHSANLLARLWYTAWFSGAAFVNIEASTGYLFDTVYGAPEVPVDAALTEYGVLAQQLRHLMQAVDPGLPYTPFGVLLRRDHGRMTYWRGPWHHQEETVGDRATVAFFDQLFPGQSQGPGREERYLCPSPWADSFDVLVAGADARSWPAYGVLIAVGEIPWTAADLAALQAYVEAGGTLVLHAHNLAGWDPAYLGLPAAGAATSPGAVEAIPAPGSAAAARADAGIEAPDLEPATDAVTTVYRAKAEVTAAAGAGKVCLRGADGRARVVSARVGSGQVFTVLEEAGAPPFPAPLLDQLAATWLPLAPDPRVETLINRTAQGWLVLLAHHTGWHKEPTEAPVADPAAAVTVRLGLGANGPETMDPFRDRAWQPAATNADGTVSVTLAPGQLRLLRWPA